MGGGRVAHRQIYILAGAQEPVADIAVPCSCTWRLVKWGVCGHHRFYGRTPSVYKRIYTAFFVSGSMHTVRAPAQQPIG